MKPEEQNRIIADQLSTYLVCPNKESRFNLIKEGYDKKQIFLFGDINHDSMQIINKEIKKYEKNKLKNFNLKKQNYAFITIHREENSKINDLLKLIEELNKTNFQYICKPLHPKFKKFKKKIIRKN